MGLHMPTSIWHSFLNIAKSGHHVITISKACSESDGCGQVGQDKHQSVTSQPSHCRLQATQDDSRLFGLAPVEPCSVSCVRSWFRNTIASYLYCSYRSYHVSEMLKLETRFACKFHRNTHGRGPTVTPNKLSPFLICLNHSCMFILGHGMSLHLKRLSGELCSCGRPCPGTVEETRKLCNVRFLPTIYGLAPWFLNSEIAPGACGKVTWQVIVSAPADTGTCQKRIKEADLKHAETVCKQRKA